MSIPECERERDAALMLPASVRLNVVARAACLGVSGLYGVTQYVKGLRAARAVWREEGMASGSADRNGDSMDGVE